MKKFLILSLFALLIMAFTAAAYAQKLDFRASGFIDVQTNLEKNNTTGNAGAGMYNTVPAVYRPGGAGYDETTSWLHTRARLKFDAVMGKELSGTIYFEMDASRWGEVSGTGDQRNLMGYWSGDRGALEIKNVYIDFAVPGIPVPISMRAGLQPLSIRNNMFIYTDGMGITTNVKVDPANIGIYWFKALENADYSADDVDVYGLQFNAKVASITVGGYGFYYNMNSYPFPSPTNAKTNYEADFWWLGAFADGKAGPVNLNFDFIYDRGTVERRYVPGVQDVKYRGFATRLKIDYPWEKANFGFVGMYASGADTNKTDAMGLANGTNSKVSAYVMPPASESFAIFTEGIVFYGTPLNTTDSGISIAGNYTQVSRGTIGGTWMAKLYGSYQATPWYKVSLWALYIGDTTKHGNTVGTARKADGTLRDDSTIGWEFDLINEFQVYKNLKYSIGAGVMAVGKGMEYWDGVGNDKPKTPWAFITNLTYTF